MGTARGEPTAYVLQLGPPCPLADAAACGSHGDTKAVAGRTSGTVLAWCTCSRPLIMDPLPALVRVSLSPDVPCPPTYATIGQHRLGDGARAMPPSASSMRDPEFLGILGLGAHSPQRAPAGRARGRARHTFSNLTINPAGSTRVSHRRAYESGLQRPHKNTSPNFDDDIGTRYMVLTNGCVNILAPSGRTTPRCKPGH